MNNLIFTQNESIATIMFSRPKALNALNTDVFSELNQVLDKIEASESIRVVILSGEGKAFIAGADIAEMNGKNEEEALAFSQVGQQVMKRIENLPQIFIGASMVLPWVVVLKWLWLVVSYWRPIRHALVHRKST